MLQDLLVIHQSNRALPLEEAVQPGDIWINTCLRQVLITRRPEVLVELASLLDAQRFIEAASSLPRPEVFQGVDAYRFVLEVICGAHSPVFGETEVLGQFRESIQRHLSTSDDQLMARTIRSWLEDAKQIRSRFLRDFGGKSYGSLLREELRSQAGEIQKIDILGAGNFAAELFPWLSSLFQVRVICRNPMAAITKDERQRPWSEHQVFSLENWADLPSPDVVILAAPISAIDLPRVAPQAFRWIDFRGESVSDPLSPWINQNASVLNLTQIFERMQNRTSLQHALKMTVLDEIKKISEQRNLRIEHRPYGWEDVCA